MKIDSGNTHQYIFHSNIVFYCSRHMIGQRYVNVHVILLKIVEYYIHRLHSC